MLAEAHQSHAATQAGPGASFESRRFLTEATTRQLRAGEHAYYEGDPDSHVYRIASGIVRLYRLLSDGRRQIISFHFAGDMIGFDTGEERSCSAEAVTAVTLKCLPMQIANQRLREDADFGCELVEMLAAELANARNQLALLNRRSAMEKLSAFILDLLSREQPRDGASLDLRISRADIADFLGLTIETVSRSLTKLRRQKVIAMPEIHRLVILDMARLERLASGAVVH